MDVSSHSLSAILLALFHKELDPSQGLIKSTGEAALIIFLAVAAFSMLFLSGWLTSRIKILDFIKKKLESYLKHEQAIWIHRLMLLATALIFIHVLLIPEVTQNKFFVSLFSFVSLIIMSLYLWTAFAPQAKGLEGHLKDCQKIGNHIVKLTISVPEQSQLNIQPGDFVFISFPEYPKMKEPHPFSVFNVPNMKQNIEFVIREVGDFTQQLASLELGSRVSISQGFGQYQSIIKMYQPSELFIIAGGIGIVPLMAIMEANSHIKTTLFYSVKRQEDFVHMETLKKMFLKGNLHVFSQVGRHSEDIILREFSTKSANSVVLLGGPTGSCFTRRTYWYGKNVAKTINTAGSSSSTDLL